MENTIYVLIQSAAGFTHTIIAKNEAIFVLILRAIKKLPNKHLYTPVMRIVRSNGHVSRSG
jgi:hypothetical protein